MKPFYLSVQNGRLGVCGPATETRHVDMGAGNHAEFAQKMCDALNDAYACGFRDASKPAPATPVPGATPCQK